MPKVKRDPVQEHIIIPDTNILWDKDKKNSVSPDFSAFWARSTLRISLSLAIPEVVFGELQFQQATSAIKCATTITDQISELSGISDSKYAIRLDPQKIQKQVGNKLEKWIKSLNGIVVNTPVASIDWPRLIQDAIWRKSSFTSDPKNKDNEKGFRDALILETLLDVCEKNKGSTKNIVFLCNDFLLRTSAELRLKHNRMVMVFESLSDFESYIKLTQQELTNKFVKSIQTHARAKFYSDGDPSTIYFRDNIKNTISQKFSAELAVPITHKLESLQPIGLMALPSYNWSVSEERWWINSTRFDELIQPREYHWVSRVTVARLLNGSLEGGGGLMLAGMAGMPLREEVLLIGFDIKWKANVKADGRFHDISVIDITKAESSQSLSTEDIVNRWKLFQNDTSVPT